MYFYLETNFLFKSTIQEQECYKCTQVLSSQKWQEGNRIHSSNIETERTKISSKAVCLVPTLTPAVQLHCKHLFIRQIQSLLKT